MSAAMIFRLAIFLLLGSSWCFAQEVTNCPPPPTVIYHAPWRPTPPIIYTEPLPPCPAPIVEHRAIIVRQVVTRQIAAPVVVPARPGYTPQGVTAFAKLFQAAAAKGVENAMVRGFNATQVQTDDCKTGPCAEVKK